MEVAEPTQKLYFVRARTMRKDRGPREITKVEVKAEEKKKPRGKRVKDPFKFKVQGLSKQDEPLEKLAQTIKAREQKLRQEVPSSVEEEALRKRLEEQAILPSEKERRKEEAKKASEKQREENLMKMIEKFKIEFPALVAPPAPAPLPAPPPAPPLPPGPPPPTPITPAPVTAQTIIPEGSVYGGKTVVSQLKLLFANNANYKSNIASLERIPSASLDARIQGTRSVLAPQFVAALQQVLGNKIAVGKGLDFKGGDLFMDAARGFVQPLINVKDAVVKGIKNEVQPFQDAYDQFKPLVENAYKEFSGGQLKRTKSSKNVRVGM
jgi:hypothetical protein